MAEQIGRNFWGGTPAMSSIASSSRRWFSLTCWCCGVEQKIVACQADHAMVAKLAARLAPHWLEWLQSPPTFMLHPNSNLSLNYLVGAQLQVIQNLNQHLEPGRKRKADKKGKAGQTKSAKLTRQHRATGLRLLQQGRPCKHHAANATCQNMPAQKPTFSTSASGTMVG